MGVGFFRINHIALIGKQAIRACLAIQFTYVFVDLEIALHSSYFLLLGSVWIFEEMVVIYQRFP